MTVGFIGTGNMAAAMIKGITGSGLITNGEIYLSDIDETKLAAFKNAGINVSNDNNATVQNSDCIFLTVKPQFYAQVLDGLKNIKNIAGKIFITVAPGITTEFIRRKLGADAKVIRTMPNTPALVGEGVTAVAYPRGISAEEYSFAKKIIGAFSDVYEMDEALLDPIISVSGSSPAYVYMFIDAIAKSGAAQGIDYETALKAAAKTVRGAAKLLLESPDAPQILTDRVCSKGGTTIEAVNHLKDSGFSEIIDAAMKKCTNRALELRQ
jgi:pyrroline-5-carboxylate reductase